MKTFKVGDRVGWQSQAAGSTKTKVGTVVRVVPAHEKPGVTSDERVKYSDSVDPRSLSRDHDSYLVQVPALPGSKARPKLYWPRVSLLELVL